MSTENQPEWIKDFYETFTKQDEECGCSEWDIETGNPDQVKSFIRTFASSLLDEVKQLEQKKVLYSPDDEDPIKRVINDTERQMNCGYNQAVSDLNTKVEAIKQRNGL